MLQHTTKHYINTPNYFPNSLPSFLYLPLTFPYYFPVFCHLFSPLSPTSCPTVTPKKVIFPHPFTKNGSVFATNFFPLNPPTTFFGTSMRIVSYTFHPRGISITTFRNYFNTPHFFPFFYLYTPTIVKKFYLLNLTYH